jgi:nickel-dependent lactate racemase
MISKISYGTGEVELDGVPLDRFEVIRGDSFVSRRSEEAVFCEAMDQPVSGRPLAERLRPGMKVAVVIPDRTRVCGSDRFLPWVLERLTRAGLTGKDVTIVFAVGTHTAQSDDDRKRLLGEQVSERWRVMEPNCRDKASLVRVGITARGTEVFLNREVAEADLVVACGAVIHHYFAGMGGGPKLIVPGVAGEATIFTNHRRAIAPDGNSHPDCQDGKTFGNPLWEDLLEAAQMAPSIYHIGLILDDKNRIGKAFGGDLVPSHQSACQEAKSLHEVPIAEKRPVIIVSPGGIPRDINFIQSHKALQHASYALADDGVMILVAKCPDGVGSETFLEWMQYSSAQEMAAELATRYTLHGQTAMAHRKKLDRATVICISDMPDELVGKLGMIPAGSIKEAWTRAQEFLSEDFRGYILPNGFVDIPFYSKEQ